MMSNWLDKVIDKLLLLNNLWLFLFGFLGGIFSLLPNPGVSPGVYHAPDAEVDLWLSRLLDHPATFVKHWTFWQQIII